MPLVKSGRIIEDRFVRVLDDAPLPEGLAILVPAARYLADSADFASRTAPTGVLWPNSRKISELAPYLDRLALIGLIFPNFRDGRAYSQARQLRENFGFRGELRATGEILRDQFLFLIRAGFDAFEVKKENDAAAFAAAVARYTVYYQPTAYARPSALQQRLLHPRISGERNSREFAR